MTLLWILACSNGEAPEALPTSVSVAALVGEGEAISVLVELEDPRLPPRLRYSSGIIAWDGHQVLGCESPQVCVDLLSGELTALEEVGEGGASMSLHRDGPLGGFSLSLEDGELSLQLPRRPVPLPLLDGVMEVLAAEIVSVVPDTRVRDLLDARFRAVRALHVQKGSAILDGRLGEWRGRSMAIEDAAHLSGPELGWRGRRDGSFSMAARAAEQGIMVGLRVRDDSIVPGDALLARLGEEEPIRVDLARSLCASPARCAFGDPIGPGRTLELLLPTDRPPVMGEGLPLLVSMLDADPGEPASTMVNAPSMRSLSMASLILPVEPSL